ncbi:hypothetical protein [Streptomyces sp. NPDC060243]|uniref:hypothetical protein n=1 Tax=Streptomyces sp. NPDC060243 TaxID=3347081 RepID=UPI003669ED94
MPAEQPATPDPGTLARLRREFTDLANQHITNGTPGPGWKPALNQLATEYGHPALQALHDELTTPAIRLTDKWQ